jgi:F-box/leucine-rich repeat protein 10/11
MTFYGPDRRPMIVRPEQGGIEGMGGKLPDANLTVSDVAEQLGRNHTVDVIGMS